MPENVRDYGVGDVPAETDIRAASVTTMASALSARDQAQSDIRPMASR